MYWTIFFAAMMFVETGTALVVKNSLTNYLSLSPGDDQMSSIQLLNDSDKAVTVNLSPSGYAYNSDGETFFPDPSTQPRSNATWIELPIDHVVIPPQGDVDIFYKIHVPDDRSLNGSYWSLILIEPDTVESKSVSDEQKDFQLNIKVRYAHQIVTDIGTGKSDLKLVNKSIEKLPDHYVLHLDLANTGTLYLLPKLTLRLYDSLGKELKILTTNQEKILPGSSIRFSIDLGNYKEKKIFGFVLLDHGDKVLFGHRLELQLPE